MNLATHLCAQFIERHPRDAARVMESLSDDGIVEVLGGLSPDRVANTLVHTDRRICRRCLKQLIDADAAHALERMPVDFAAAVLRETEKDHRNTLLSLLSARHRRSLELLLHYPDHSAGRAMDPLFPCVIVDLTVGGAIKRLRQDVLRASLCVYVTDTAQRFVGLLDLRKLIGAEPNDRIAPLVEESVANISAMTELDSLVNHPDMRAYGSLPVVTEGLTYIGAVREESVLAHDPELHREAALDHARQTGAALGELFRLGFGGLVQSADHESMQRTPVRARKEEAE